MCGFADQGYEEPGRPEGLPHTATIKRVSGTVAAVIPFMVLRSTRILKAAKPLIADLYLRLAETIGAHFGAHNRAVGRFGGLWSKAQCHCLRGFHGIPRGVECRGKSGAGFGVDSLLTGNNSPRYKR